MHPAPPFRVSDGEALIAHLSAYPFMGFFAAGEAGLRVAHAPVVLRREGEGVALDFHLSRNNVLSPVFAQGAAALAVSQGPEAYVSPDWYERPDQVPTWNYLTIEAEGEVTPLGEAELIQMLDDLSARLKPGSRPSRPGTATRCRRAGLRPCWRAFRAFACAPIGWKGPSSCPRTRSRTSGPGWRRPLATTRSPGRWRAPPPTDALDRKRPCAH
jgi:hypothetical protein